MMTTQADQCLAMIRCSDMFIDMHACGSESARQSDTLLIDCVLELGFKMVKRVQVVLEADAVLCVWIGCV